MFSLAQRQLPDIQCQYLTIHVSTVVDVNHFWAQYVDRETSDQMKLINAYLSRPLTCLPSSSIEIGMICAAPFHLSTTQLKNSSDPSGTQSENQRTEYYRARVNHRLDNVTVEVFFIDWGNTEQVPIDQLRLLDSALLRLPPMAFECQLWSIRPNVARYPLNSWPIQALNLVCSLILERQMDAEIKAVARNLVKCDILLDMASTARSASSCPSNHIDEHQQGRATLRQILINKGFAEAANEEHLFEVRSSLRHS